MHCRHCIVCRIVQKNGHTVGCGDAYADSGNIGEDAIDAFEQHPAYVLRQREKFPADDARIDVVCLMRHYDVALLHAQDSGKSLAALGGVLWRVAAILVHVETGIVALARSAVACGAERRHSGSGGVGMEQRSVIHRSPPHTQNPQGRPHLPPRCILFRPRLLP